GSDGASGCASADADSAPLDSGSAGASSVMGAADSSGVDSTGISSPGTSLSAAEVCGNSMLYSSVKLRTGNDSKVVSANAVVRSWKRSLNSSSSSVAKVSGLIVGVSPLTDITYPFNLSTGRSSRTVFSLVWPVRGST